VAYEPVYENREEEGLFMNNPVELQCSCYSLFIFMLGERTRLQNLNYLVGSLGLNEKGRYSRDRRKQVVGNRTGYRDSSETKPQTARGVAAESSKKINHGPSTRHHKETHAIQILNPCEAARVLPRSTS
jgi:hypothetical protein